MCDIVIPFHEQDTVLSNKIKTTVYCLLSFFLLPQDDNTALIRASKNGHVNVVEMLLAAGADPHHQSKVRNLVTMVMLIHVPNAFVPNKVLHFFLDQ